MSKLVAIYPDSCDTQHVAARIGLPIFWLNNECQNVYGSIEDFGIRDTDTALSVRWIKAKLADGSIVSVPGAMCYTEEKQ